jgi:hypothetical protein
MRSLFVTASLVVFGMPGLQPSARAAQAPRTPRLAVAVVIDRLRTDYLDTPSTHGMVLNGRWDPAARASAACTDDTDSRRQNAVQPSTVAPAATWPSAVTGTATARATRTSMQAAAAAATPPPGDNRRPLLVNTLADELRTLRPGSRGVALVGSAFGASSRVVPVAVL